MLALVRQIALRHVTRAPLRTLLVLLGIALGVAMYVATEAANRSIVLAFEDMVQRVAGRADLVVRAKGGALSSEIVADIADLDEVAHAAASLEIPIRESRGGDPLLVLGVDLLGDTHFLPFDVSEGESRVVEDPLAFVNDPSAILVSKSLASARKLEVGGEIELVSSAGPKKLVVRGVLDDSGLGAAFGGQVAIVSLDAAQLTFAKGTRVDRIDVALEEGISVEAARAAIAQVAGEGARVELPSARVRRVQRAMEPFHNAVFLSGFIALIVGMFLVYNAVGISVAQRRREIGVLRSLGVTRARAVLLFCIEALILAIPAIALGIAVARPIAALALDQTVPTITQVFLPIRPPPPVVDRDVAIAGAILGILTTLVAALWPAIGAARVNPVESLRPAVTMSLERRVPWASMAAVGIAATGGAWLVARSTHHPVLAACAMLLNAAGAILFVPAGVVILHRVLAKPLGRALGAATRLGLDNVERTLGRSALNVAALMAAVSLAVTVGGWLTSLQNNVRMTLGTLIASDVQITAGSPLNDQYNVQFEGSTLAKLAGVAGVREVIPARVIEQDVGEESMRLVGVASDLYLTELAARNMMPELVSGAPLAPRDLLAAPRIVLNEAASRAFSKRAGDTLTLPTPTGERSFEVRAVFVDYSESALGYLDRKHVVEAWGDDSLDNIDLCIAPGADIDRVIEGAKSALGGGELLFVTRSSAVVDEVMKVVNQAFAYARSVELVTLLIALLGVVATLTAAVIDRTREIATLSAIGAARSQIAKMVIAEATFLGFVAGSTGVLAGVIQGALLLGVIETIGRGMRLAYAFPVESAIRVVVLVVVTAALAGVLPARRATRLDVKEALAWE